MEGGAKNARGGKRKDVRKADEITEKGIDDPAKVNAETVQGKKARQQKADKTSDDSSCSENKRRKQSVVSNTDQESELISETHFAEGGQISILKTMEAIADKLLQEKEKPNDQCCQDKSSTQYTSTKNAIKNANSKVSVKQKKSDGNSKKATKVEKKPVAKTKPKSKSMINSTAPTTTTDMATKKVVNKHKNGTNTEMGNAKSKGNMITKTKKELDITHTDTLVQAINQDYKVSNADGTPTAINISSTDKSTIGSSAHDINLAKTDPTTNTLEQSWDEQFPIDYSKPRKDRSSPSAEIKKICCETSDENTAGDIGKQLNSKTPGNEITTPDREVEKPETEIKKPECEKTHENDNRTSESDCKKTESDIKPGCEMKTPKNNSKTSGSDSKASEYGSKINENDKTLNSKNTGGDLRISNNDSKVSDRGRKKPKNGTKNTESHKKLATGDHSKAIKKTNTAKDNNNKILDNGSNIPKVKKAVENDINPAEKDVSSTITESQSIENNSSSVGDSINGLHSIVTDTNLPADAEALSKNNLKTNISKSVPSDSSDKSLAVTDDRHFACSHCAYRAKHRVQLRRHLGTHGVYECAHCTFVSSSNIELQSHLRASHPARCDRKRCPQCGRVVPAAQMEQHSASCTGELQPWKCTICQREFRYECQLRVHSRTHDVKSDDSSDVSSTVTGTPASDAISDTTNNDKVSDEKDTPTISTANDNSTNDTVLHRTISSMPAVADEPSPSTSSSTDVPCVAATISTYAQIRAFSCDVSGCNESFSKRMLLVEHKQYTHGIVRQFACEHPGCTLRFSKKSQLTRHGIVHTDERNFICKWPGCNKAFRHSDNLRVHFRRHSSGQPIRCEICSFSCHQHNSLKYHMDSEHSSVLTAATTLATTTDVIQSLTTELAEFSNTTSMTECSKVSVPVMTPCSGSADVSPTDTSTQITEKQESAICSTDSVTTTTTTTDTTSTATSTTTTTSTSPSSDAAIASISTSKPDIYDFNDDDEHDGNESKSLMIRPKLAGRSPGSSSLDSCGDVAKVTSEDQKISPDVTANTPPSSSKGKDRKGNKSIKDDTATAAEQSLSKPLRKKKAGAKICSSVSEKDMHSLKNKVNHPNEDTVQDNEKVVANKKSLPKNKKIVAPKKCKAKKQSSSRKRLSAEEEDCDPSKKLCYANDEGKNEIAMDHAIEIPIAKTAELDECTMSGSESDITMHKLSSDTNLPSDIHSTDNSNLPENSELAEDSTSMNEMAIDGIPFESPIGHNAPAAIIVDSVDMSMESSPGNYTETLTDQQATKHKTEQPDEEFSSMQVIADDQSSMLESQQCPIPPQHVSHQQSGDKQVDGMINTGEVVDTAYEQPANVTACDNPAESAAENIAHQEIHAPDMVPDHTEVQHFGNTILTDSRLLESPVSHILSQKEVDELSIPSIPNGSPSSDFGDNVVAMSADDFKESNDLCATTEPFVMSPANPSSLPGTPNSIELPDDAAMFGVGVPVITASSQSKLDDILCHESGNDPTEQLAAAQSPPFTVQSKNAYEARELYGNAPSYGVMEKPALHQEAEVSHQAYPANNTPYSQYSTTSVERPSVLTPNPTVPPTPEYSPPPNVFPVAPIGQSGTYGCTGSMMTAGDAYSSSPHPSFLLDPLASKMHESLHDIPTYSFGRDVDVTSGKNLPAPCFPPESFTPKDFFSQYFSGQDPSTLPLSHLSTQQDQRLGYTQRSSFDMLPRAPMLPTPTYGGDSLIASGITPAWCLDERVRPAWPQPTSLVPPAPSQLGRPPSFNRSDFGFDASRGLNKHAEAFAMPQPVADPYNPYMPRPFAPAVSYARPPVGGGQKHLDNAYRHPDYRGLPGTDLYGRMGVNPALSLDKYYYQRDAMYRQPFMPPASSAQSPYSDYSCTPYAQHSAAAAAAAAAAYGLMGDKQYLSTKMADNVPSLPDRSISATTTGDYLQGQRPGDSHIQDQYHRSVIYNMMSRYY